MGQEIVFGPEDSDAVFSEVKAVEAPAPERQNVVRKNVVAKTTGKVGSVAHYHRQENEEEAWDEPCLFVSHNVGVQGGLSAGDQRYVGNVVVPQCLADYLAWQRSAKLVYERGIYRSKNINKFLRNL